MKLRRRIGSVFLAFAMALSLIPSVAVSALAAPEDESITVTGDGPMTTADRAVDFYLYTTQLYKLVMLEDSAVDETTRITKVTLLLNEKHPARGTEIDFVREGETKAETDRFHLNVQNYGNTIEPDNIRGIRISYVYSNESGADVTVSPGALCLDSDIVYGPLGNENGVTYDVMSSNDQKSIVAFYDNGGNGQQTAYSLYDAYLVDTGSCLNDINSWPTTPTYTAYTFVNWDTNKGGGAPFLGSTIVNGDTEVFSQKITTDGTSAGTEIHVMNRNNELIDRFVELYNAKTGRTITSNDVILNDQFKITVYGEGDTHTNPDYSAGVGSSDYNHWINNSEYYMVVNRDVNVPVAFDENWNIQVNHSEITKIVVSAQVKLSDETVIGEVTINKGTAPGDFAVSFITNPIIELHILQEGEVEGEPDVPHPPEPTEPDLSVTKSVEIPDGKETASVGDTLEYTITVTNSGDAVAEDVEVWDSLWTDPNSAVLVNKTEPCVPVADGFCAVDVPANGETTIYYTYTVPEEKAGQKLTNNVWIGENNVGDPDATVTVTVDEEQPEVPNAPDEGDIPGILGEEDAVLVKCVSNAGHALAEKYYNLVANDTENIRYQVGDVVVNGDGTITCTVTILPDVYVARYNGEEDLGAIQHKLVTEEAQTVTLSWTQADGWIAPDRADDTPWATFKVECAPGAPTTDDLNELFPNGVQVDCTTTPSESGHLNQDYDLEDGTYTTTVEQENGQWTCKVTVKGETYVEKYEEYIGWSHTANDATQSVTLVWEDGQWAKKDNNNVMVVFDVTCEAPEKPDYDDLKGLFKVQIDCITSDKWGDQYEHQNKDYTPIKDSYTLGDVTANAGGTWELVVTVQAEQYVEAYNEAIGVEHTPNVETEKTVTLVYQDGAWTKTGNDIAFSFDVKCAPKYDLVYHGCGGKTENGKDRVSSTNISYFGEVTIKNNPFLRDGYVFEGWALEDGGEVKYQGSDEVIFNDVNFPGLSENKGANLYAVWSLDEPDADDIANLDIKVVIDCIDNVGHEDETYDLLDNRVTGSSDVYTLGPVDQDTETCKLTIFAAEYVKAYGEEENIQARHKLADANVWYQTIELKWVGGKWTADTNKVTFNVTGDKEDDPNEPAVVNYTVNYFYDGEQNKDASYTGWGRERDVVSQYIDKSGDGYTLDKATGVPLTLAVDGENIINVYYATDKWNAETDDPTTGDSIPDYKQVLIAYTTDGSGTVSPTTQVETLEDNADGKYVGTVNVGSTATANEGYAFAFWMGPNDSTFWSKDLNTTLTVEGGKTYTYTATFGTDLIGPEDPTGEDPDNPGDGIPDKYQVVVKYVAGKGGKITGKQVEVLTITVDGHYSTVGDVTATGSQAAASHNWDFSRWVAPNGGVAGWNPTLDQQIIKNAVGGGTYVFTALFRYDPYTPPVVDPDPDDPTPPVDPDKPQLNTEDHYAYIVGYEDGTVRPEGDITRAEVATIFFRLLTDESRNEYWSQTNDYTDVAEGDWYNNAVSTLSKAGILNGYEDGSFRPNGNITRAEFATIAARFFEATYEGEDLFPDIEGHWARDYINQAAHAGIVNGYEDGTFQPQENITRAEAMTIVNRTLDRHPDADHFLADMITWPDNLESAWYYEQVQEATNSHEYVMKTDKDQNRYEDWTKLLEIRDWSDLENTWSEAHAG